MATQVRQEQPAANAQLGLSCGQKALSDCTKLQPTRPRLVSLKQQVLSNCAEQNDGLAVKNGGLTMFNLIVCVGIWPAKKGQIPKKIIIMDFIKNNMNMYMWIWVCRGAAWWKHFLTFVGFWVSIYFGTDSYGYSMAQTWGTNGPA